ncbi:MAG TPA: peptidoglycan DD-metalloendopeptidase family protein [Gemmatimonadales bacterium]|nr:peptidoglycan DD-metalloendopeptidase family protein [Gemmatimonadales bacterium]
MVRTAQRWQGAALARAGLLPVPARSHLLLLLLLLLPLLPLPLLLSTPLAAQQSQTRELDESRRRLEEIKAERDRLQSQRQRLQGQVHDASADLKNIERQKESTERIVHEIERQIGGLSGQIDRSSAELILAQDNLAERRAILERRLIDIYKRGALYAFQVLLTAESFGDLLSRYKYLYLTSRQDRALVDDVELLRKRVVGNRNDVLRVRGELDRRRQEREAEYQRFGTLAQERARRIHQLQRTARTTEQRLSALERDELRLSQLLATLERARREELARRRAGLPVAAVPGALTTADIGKLDWPVDGRIIYRFGRDTLPSGGVIRWNGIGIQAAAGTPVHSVEAGKVRLVGQFGTYGLTVLLEHGNGYYSVYSHLQAATVKLGDVVSKGQAIGAVGGISSEHGSHLHFEIRGENQIALDPADWLKKVSGKR